MDYWGKMAQLFYKSKSLTFDYIKKKNPDSNRYVFNVHSSAIHTSQEQIAQLSTEDK